MPPTIRTARSRSSGGHLFDVLPEMTPSFPRTGVSGHAGAVHAGLGGVVLVCDTHDRIIRLTVSFRASSAGVGSE